MGLVIGVGVFALNAWVRRGAPERHARYRMRARLARWLYEGKLRPVSLRVVKRRRTAKRRAVLSVVRRDDSTPGAA